MIIFVAGGMTYSEMRSAYEIADIHNREVIIGKWRGDRLMRLSPTHTTAKPMNNDPLGSSHIVTPAGYVQDLSMLRKPTPIPHRVIPPYSPPAPPPQESARSLRPHIPHMSRSQSPSPLPSVATSKSSESAMDSDKSEKQKKKKGLGRLFG